MYCQILDSSGVPMEETVSGIPVPDSLLLSPEYKLSLQIPLNEIGNGACFLNLLVISLEKGDEDDEELKSGLLAISTFNLFLSLEGTPYYSLEKDGEVIFLLWKVITFFNLKLNNNRLKFFYRKKYLKWVTTKFPCSTHL